MLQSEERQEAFGVLLGELLAGGDCVGLIGELGTGKTTTCRGIGRGLECTEPLRSPTYLLCHEVDGRHPVLHLDAYFDVRMDSLLGEGLCERFDEASVLLVEWADRCESWWPEDRLELRLEVATEGRELKICALGPRSAQIQQALENSAKKAGFL
ncbi:MAG: tRNA (adenosine(37)-N6)-threonylcarbamoyltransferase complex ATPase subunit type 1 TsaE [Planctomycetes bacterium]|nr:tRNA (adenosine(37)-N6)-threonylcarbamoyltransferase complex ATPase subunit type 1 TsaE [Planctomycetota bacterium]MCP4770798.1 tRNA (adenosine(37)-N6)-threonylcarbamoyltransferase complex ATPase subunit type 1 TsaE [Planctomycetota bacterium]MCP4861338.1 tRNA (adenosine(37)-N6)-threonylcarbamoyltransferase complex ATPase subunit type 1 TsaE [Planctomycetota bacterium]